MLVGGCGSALILFFIHLQTFSIGLRSGELGGQSKVRIPLLSFGNLAFPLWIFDPSSIKINFERSSSDICAQCGKTTPLSTWFKYALLQIPFIPSSFLRNTSGDFQSQPIAPYTITLDRPDRYTDFMQSVQCFSSACLVTYIQLRFPVSNVHSLLYITNRQSPSASLEVLHQRYRFAKANRCLACFKLMNGRGQTTHRRYLVCFKACLIVDSE